MEVLSANAGAIGLTALLATVTTAILFVIGIPLAWWLAQGRGPLRAVVRTTTALPLVLPPTVLGFYLLILFRPDAPLGSAWVSLTGSGLTFSFSGLVVASVLYSLPFMVQPLHNAFSSMGAGPMEAAATLGASPLDSFFSVALPKARDGLVTAGVLSFAHTVGEFGVVLMVGGNIPGQTRVLSIAIYEHVETLDYASAHWLSAGLLVFAFLVLLTLYGRNHGGFDVR